MTGKFPASLGADSQAVVGNARFTVITPFCVRMEYSKNHGFVDQPTLFAINREVRLKEAKFILRGKTLTVKAGNLRVHYTNDEKPFDAGNLRATFREAGEEIVWTPDAKPAGNLGGPVSTLDGWRGPDKVNDGLLSRDGWHVLDDSGAALLSDRGIIQRAGGIPPKSVSSERENVATKDIDWYLFMYGSDFKAALKSLSAVSGKVPMPRRHVLGSWYCRWFDYTSDDFRQLVEEYRHHDFPLDIMVMDMGWHTQENREDVARGQSVATTGFGHAKNLGWSGYTWNKKLIPDPGQLLKEFRDDGLFVTLNDHPCDGMRAHEEHYGDFMKLLPEGTPDNPPFNAGDPRYMESFFKSALGPLEKQGVDFWWLDWQQDYIYPYVLGVPGLRHLPWLNHLYYKHSESGGRRGQGFSRWGGWGDHRHPIQFSGDTWATWPMLEFEIAFTAFSGNAGCFFWAHDLGGFASDDERNPEMFTRWVQFGAFSPSLRVHSCGDKLDRRPWLWGKRFEDSMRSAYHLRSRLMPYIYSSVRQCHDQTLPLVRPMYIEFPEEEEAYKHPQQYLFGDTLLVAPIAAPGTGQDLVAEQTVWFPRGTWYHLVTGRHYNGESIEKIEATIDEIPVFVKGGIPLPMQPYTSRMATAALSTLIVRCYPGESGSSVLYEDDGQSNDYTTGHFSTTDLRYTRRDHQVTVTIGPAIGSFRGQVAERGYLIELPATPKALNSTVNGQNSPVTYNIPTQTNTINIPPQSITKPLTVTVRFRNVLKMKGRRR